MLYEGAVVLLSPESLKFQFQACTCYYAHVCLYLVKFTRPHCLRVFPLIIQPLNSQSITPYFDTLLYTF